MLRPHLLQVMALQCRPVKSVISPAVQKAIIIWNMLDRFIWALFRCSW